MKQISEKIADLTDEEADVAISAVNDYRNAQKIKTELHQMSEEDAEKAKGKGSLLGDPFLVIE